MDEIIINSGEYFGPIIKYSIGCVDTTSIKITPKPWPSWISFILPPDKDDNVVKMQVSENKTGSQREQTFTVTYSINKGGETVSCTEGKQFTIKQRAKVDPCGMFIVDGGEENVDAQGKHKESGRYPCDSMLLLYSEQPEAHFDPAEASDWVNIEFVSWGDATKTKDYNNYCTVYTDNPCVADYLLYQAGVVSEHVTCDSSTPLANFPQVVQDAVTGSTQYTNALGTIWYKVKPNTGAKRDFTISWTVGGKDCPPSKNLIIHQDAGSGPTPTCTCTATGHKNPLPSTTTTEAVLLGTYSSTCSGTWSAAVKEGYTDFLSDFEFREDGNIYAKVSKVNPGKQITSYYNATIGDCLDEFTVVQAGTEPGCNVSVTLTGLDEGDTVKLKWGESEPIDIGNNETKDHTLVSDTDSIIAYLSDPTVKYNFSESQVELTCYDFSKTITATKITPTCTCQEANVQVGTTAITLGNAAYSTANTTYIHDCTVYINNNEAEGWLNVNSTNDKLEFNSTSQATSTRSANVYIDDANGKHCKTINVTQNGCGDKLNISYGILFENQPVAVDSLSDNAVYSVGGAEVNYTKCDGSKGSFLISAAYGTTDTFVNFRKGDFIDGNEAIKTTSFTVSDLTSIDSITLPQFISVGGGRNIWGTTEELWGGDFRNLSEKIPGETYAYRCYASCITNDSLINARNTYTRNGNNLTIYLSFEEIVL